VDREHPQYAGALPFERQVELIVQGKGSSGENPEYLESMVRHLDEAGVSDKGLSDLWVAVKARL
jgi:cation transport protein ChaC